MTPQLGPQVSGAVAGALAYLSQEHRVLYLPAATRTVYRMRLTNRGDQPVAADTLTVYGAVPAGDDELELAARTLAGEHPAPGVRVVADTGTRKQFEVTIPGGLAPGGTYAYAVAMTWPLPGPLPVPLVGARYYELPVHRPTDLLRCRIVVPAGYRITGAVITERRQGIAGALAPAVVPPLADETRLVWRVGLPQLGSTYRVDFEVAEAP